MRPGRAARAREILEHGLARDAGIGVGAGRRRGRRLLGRAAVVDVDIGINAAGRIGDDARAGERLGDQRGHVRVHRPGQVLMAGRAELAAGHEHHVGKLRQRLDLLAVEQIGRDAFDAPGGELLAQARLAEARDADHALAGCGALGEPRQGRSDLAADAEDDRGRPEAARARRPAPATGAVITSSRCSTSRKRSGSAAGDAGMRVFPRRWARTADRGVSNQLDTTWTPPGSATGPPPGPALRIRQAGRYGLVVVNRRGHHAGARLLGKSEDE